MAITITPAEHMDFIKKGTYDDNKIKKLIEDGVLDAKKLVEFGVLTQDKINSLFYVSPQQHMNNIKNGDYAISKIKSLLEDKTINEADLIRLNILNNEQINEILGRPVSGAMITFDEFDWKDVPPLMPDRVDVFVLGIAGSGKSSFMAGLIYYAEMSGRLSIDISNNKGYIYANSLISAVENRLLPPATPVEYIQFMACDFLEEENSRVKHPLSFIEMSGEVFEKSYGVSLDKLPPKFNDYLFKSPNNKIIFLTVDYNIHEENIRLRTPQRTQFDFILKFFEKNGTLNSTEAICILITKWDENKDQSPEASREFLRREYLSLYRLCERLGEDFNLKFEVFTFSLGNFDERKRYKYDDRDSRKLLNWLSSFSPVRKEKKKGGFGGLFSGR